MKFFRIISVLFVALHPIYANAAELQPEQSGSEWFNPGIGDLFVYLLLGVLSAYCLIAVINLSRRLDRHKKLINNLEDRVESQRQRNTPETDHSVIKTLVRQLIDTDPAVRRLEEDLRGLIVRFDRLDYRDQAKIQSSSSLVEPINDTNQGIFYMSYPVQNSFSVNFRSSTKENTVYVFYLKENGVQAEFELHTGGGVPVSSLISGVEQYIRPACIEENLPRIDARNIVTKKRGLAVLEADRWMIQQKAVISYE